MAGGYTDVKRKRRPKPGERSKKLFRILLPVALILSIAAVYELLRSKTESGPSEASYEVIPSKADSEPREAIVEMPYGSLEELSDTAAFLSAYLSVNVGGELLETTQTITITGRVESDSISQSFRLFKKRPNRLRLTREINGDSVTIGYDGSEVWQRMRPQFGDDVLQILSGPKTSLWINQARFFDRIVSAHLGIGRITGITVESYEGVEYLAVSTVDPDGLSATTLVDPNTLHASFERELREDGLAVTELSDFRNVDGIPIPFRVISRLDGEIVSRTVIESAKLNEGILDRFFAKPKGLVE